jgi:hypothetical protein
VLGVPNRCRPPPAARATAGAGRVADSRWIAVDPAELLVLPTEFEHVIVSLVRAQARATSER